MPSLFQSSVPCVPSLAEKKRVTAHGGQVIGHRAVQSGLMSLTMTVPRRAVALPQLVAVRPVVGREEERAVHVRQVGGDGAGGTRIDVLDQDGAGGRAVALPELVARGRRRWP